VAPGQGTQTPHQAALATGSTPLAMRGRWPRPHAPAGDRVTTPKTPARYNFCCHLCNLFRFVLNSIIVMLDKHSKPIIHRN
jgi:hypothetical protein